MSTAGKSKTVLYIVIGVVTVIVVGGIAWVVSSMSKATQAAEPSAQAPTGGINYTPSARGINILSGVLQSLETGGNLFTDFWGKFKKPEDSANSGTFGPQLPNNSAWSGIPFLR